MFIFTPLKKVENTALNLHLIISLMKKFFSLFVVALLYLSPSFAQDPKYSYSLDAEFGITGGVAHYYGDLNNRIRFNRPKAAFGIFFRKQFGNYIAARITGHFAQLGYSDAFNKGAFEHKRNLSFNTSIFEVALMGDFNFLEFIPTEADFAFTPYASIGVGLFSYNPYAYLDGKKYYLRPLHTEGQTFYDNRKPYGSVALCFPIAFGLKYAISEKVNISAELGYRFTTTDYIDDVSTTYVGVNKFASHGNDIAAKLQDRSYELGTPIGIEGRQRGFSKQKDQYLIFEVGLSLNLINYNCPTPR